MRLSYKVKKRKSIRESKKFLTPRVPIAADKFVSVPFGDRIYIKDRSKMYSQEQHIALQQLQARLMLTIENSLSSIIV